MRAGRRTTRWAVAAALACGLVAASVTATPSAAQETPGTTVPPAPSTTTAPPTTAEPAPPTPTTALDDAAPPSTPADATAPDSDVTTTTTTDVAPAPGDAAPAASGPAVTLDLPPGAEVVDGQALGVTVAGIDGIEYLEALQCVAGTEPTFQRCQYESTGYEVVDGAAHLTIRLDALLAVGGYDETPHRVVDCRTDAVRGARRLLVGRRRLVDEPRCAAALRSRRAPRAAPDRDALAGGALRSRADGDRARLRARVGHERNGRPMRGRNHRPERVRPVVRRRHLAG